MPSTPVPASRRWFALGMFFALQGLTHLALPAVFVLYWNVLPMVARRFVWLWLILAAILLPSLTWLESLHPYANVDGHHFFDFEILIWLNGSHILWLLANLVLLRFGGVELQRQDGVNRSNN